MFPLSQVELEKFQEQDIEVLQKLDDNGCFAGVGESFEDFKKRLVQEREIIEKFDSDIASGEEVQIFDDIKVKKDDLIGKNIIHEAAKVTQELYDFKINYLPGFFLNKDIGLLWGGCSIYDESTSQRIFLIRKNFKNSRKWFIYDRCELLSHELCHSARQILSDRKVEEFFAYQTSKSALRRYIGNCFISDIDAFLFVLPPLILLAAQIIKTYFYGNLSIVPFWGLTSMMFLFFAVRNQLARNLVFKAKKQLEKFGIKRKEAFLFRCSSDELKELGRLEKRQDFCEWIQSKAKTEIRFRVMMRKWKIDG